MADTALSGLPAASSFAMADLLEITQAGSSKKLTGALLRSGLLAGGSSSANSWPVFGTGSLLTTPEVGAFEFAGGIPYFTHASSSRGVMAVSQWLVQTATYTLTNTASAQKLFNQSANGALTVQGSTTYEFECLLYITGLSGTSGNLAFQIIGAGTATFTAALWTALGLDNTTPTTAAALGGSVTASASSSGNIVTAATGTGVFALIRGIFAVNAGGTIIPSVALTNAAAGVVQIGSYFRCAPIGSNSLGTVGNWS